MSKAKTQMIKLRDIVVPPNRMRQLRPEKVDEFAESIATRGQLQPIIVRPRGDTDYLLVVGLHRLEAVRKLGHEAIECRVLDGMDADQALLAEIDENLVRADLTPSERAAHHAKRKQLYLKLHKGKPVADPEKPRTKCPRFRQGDTPRPLPRRSVRPVAPLVIRLLAFLFESLKRALPGIRECAWS